MRRRDQQGWVARLISVLLVVALVAVVGVGWRLDLISPWYHHFTDESPAPPGTDGALTPPPPPGLRLPTPAAAPAVSTALTAPGAIDPAKVRAALAPYLADKDLGRHVVAAVADLTSGTPVVEIGDGGATPASTTKLFTTSAALAALGPETRFTTKVVSGGRGRIVLVGGGDPFLASAPPRAGEPAPYPERADVTTLARRTAKVLLKRGLSSVSLGYDDSRFSGPTFDPAWPAHYAPDHVISPVTALWVDEGHPVVSDPSLHAAEVFAAALTAAGVTVTGAPAHGVAAKSSPTLASVESAPLREIVERTLEVSDNEAAEVLSHQVGLKVNGSGSFDGGVAGVLATLQTLGVPTSGVSIHDGSGLSRENTITPEAMIAVLHADLDAAHPGQHAVIDALPVSGFTGSLTNRFDLAFPDARGLVRAKTGTLTNVSSLAGIAVDQDGHTMLFALMADRIPMVDETRARNALDEAAGALGACHCG